MLGAMTWAAFSCPSATQAVYDLIAQTWLSPDVEMKASFSEDWAEAPIPADFWSRFWEAVEGPTEGYDALTITQAIAALGGAVDDSFGPWQSNVPTRTLAQTMPPKKPSRDYLIFKHYPNAQQAALATSSIGCSLRMALTLRC